MKKGSWTPERKAKFQATMAAKRATAPKGAVVPLDDLIPGKSKHGPASVARKALQSTQPPITVTFGRVKITIEVGE
jgi:hypothetical protein